MDIFMQAAIDEALEGLRKGGVPIGAVLVENGKIIGGAETEEYRSKISSCMPRSIACAVLGSLVVITTLLFIPH